MTQDKLKTSYASIGATNAIWNIAKDRGFYKNMASIPKSSTSAARR